MIYGIWTEGFRATGESATAIFHGTQEADSFDEACIKKIGHILDKDDGEYRRMNGGMYCVWACGCYDNEKDARKGFG